MGWRDVAEKLQNQSIDDEAMLVHLVTFLDKYPALINFQTSITAEERDFKPLLWFAVQGRDTAEMRLQCVYELLKRGARPRIRHRQGFLIDHANSQGFHSLLKEMEQECKIYDKASLKAWRDVSSKLCGETSHPVSNEEEMTRIVEEFCAKYPEMVNYQGNHAVSEATDEPYGYFGYAPLISFAGAQACRRRRGRAADDSETRKGSVEALLKHGARVDTIHGGRTALDWMKAEGSQLTDWLQEQFQAPVPTFEPFAFERPDNFCKGSNGLPGGSGPAKKTCCLQ